MSHAGPLKPPAQIEARPLMRMQQEHSHQIYQVLNAGDRVRDLESPIPI